MARTASAGRGRGRGRGRERSLLAEPDSPLASASRSSSPASGSGGSSSPSRSSGGAASASDEEEAYDPRKDPGASDGAEDEEPGAAAEIDERAILQVLREASSDEEGGDEEEEEDESEEDSDGDAAGAGGAGVAPHAAPHTEEAPSEEEEDDGDAAAPSQYELLARRKREAGPSRKRTRLAIGEGTAAELDLLLAATGRRRNSRAAARRRKTRAKAGVAMPEDVERKLGEAALYYSSGAYAAAAQLLNEVIRLAPTVPDAYTLLSSVHEARGDARRALDFAMIGAHLSPRDAEGWRALAERAARLDDARTAIYCLTRVLRCEPGDAHARWDRAMLYAEVGEPRKALEGVEALRVARPDDADVARAAAKLHHALGAPDRAAELLAAFLQSQPQAADATLVNVLAELYLEMGLHAEVLALLAQAAPLLGSGPTPLDLSIKAAICHAYLGEPERAEGTLCELEAAGVAEYSDLFLAVADAFWAIGDAGRALRFLAPLRQLREFDAPALWTRIATCYTATRDLAGAAEMYADVLARHPRHPEATSAYAEVLLQLGRTQDALALLGPLEDAAQAGPSAPGGARLGPGGAGDEEAVLLRLKAARLRGQAGDVAAFLATALPLVRQSLQAEAAAVAAAVAAAAAGRGRRGGRRAKPRPDAAAPADGVFLGYVTKPKKRGRKPSAAAAAPADAAAAAAAAAPAPPPPEPPAIRMLLLDAERFAIFRSVVEALLREGRLDEAAALISSALALGRAPGRERLAALRQLAADVAEARGDAAGAAEAMRNILSTAPAPGGSVAQWNAYSRSAAAAGVTARHARALARLGSRHPGLVPCALMGAAATAAAAPRGAPGGGWGPAVPALFRAFAAAPRAPLVSLSLGCALAQHAASRAAADRGAAALAAAAFMGRYAALRGAGSAEAAFNAGRCMHALGLAHLAAPLYETALERGDAEAAETTHAGDAQQATHAGGADVRREAAHNLHLIYSAAGATHLARQLLRRYATV